MSHHKHAHHVHQRAPHGIRDTEPEKPVVVSVVYVTASKTFDGPIGGYRTLNPAKDAKSAGDEEKPRSREAKPEATSEADSDQRPTTKSSSKELDSDSELASSTSSKTTSGFATKTSSQATKQSSTDVHSRPIAKSDQLPSSSRSASIGQSTTGSAASNGSAASLTNQTPGMSGGAKAGLAIGIILIIGVLGLLLLCLKRMKSKKKSSQNTEKAASEIQYVAPRTQSFQSTRTTATAPRLSLRPVTQFLPDLGARRKSGNLLATAGGPSPKALTVPREQMSEKSTSPAQPNDSANPFGSHAEVSQGTALPVHNKPTNPFGNHAESRDEPRRGAMSPVQTPAPLRIKTPTPETAIAGGAVASNVVGAARDDRYKAPNQLNLSPSRPISPAGTEFSMNSVSTGYHANGPPPSNVYRVQLDFHPSMDDELGLQAGQLIRLLHEYDDGWALCIRLDRTQQGVAPRTCLSARPVKPRPAGNNRGPPLRGPPPVMFGPVQPRPLSPAGSRGPPSHYNREQAPMFPGSRPGPRSMSPGPYGGGPQRPNIPPPGGKRRSNSASQVRDRRNSPPGPSPMNPNVGHMQRMPMPMPMQLQAGIAAGDGPYPLRKPVPGQAM